MPDSLQVRSERLQALAGQRRGQVVPGGLRLIKERGGSDAGRSTSSCAQAPSAPEPGIWIQIGSPDLRTMQAQ